MSRPFASLSRKAALLGAAILLYPAIAGAQTPTPAAPVARPVAAKSTQGAKPAANEVQAVTVTAPTGAEDRSSIDRRSYSVSRDLQATTGSVADVLRGVPSVQVDVQGNVSLRGDPNVTIMIDGKPSGMFRGEGRGQALQQMPAAAIDRVEVMTNPSAAYSPEGAAGIINLITKQQRGAGLVGSVRANVGTGDRYNGGVSAAYNANTFTFSGDAGWRHDVVNGTIVEQRTLMDPASGGLVESRQDIGFASEGDSQNARAGVDYDPDRKTHLGVELRYNGLRFGSTVASHYLARDAIGAAAGGYNRAGAGEMDRSTTEVSGDWRRKFEEDGHALSVNLSREWTRDGRGSRATTTTDAAASAVFEDIHTGDELVLTRLKAEYTRPMPAQAKLVAGYELQVYGNDYQNYGARGPLGAPLVVDPGLTNRFIYDQTVHAIYATYQQPLGKLTVLGGLRLETATIETNQVTSDQQDRQDYIKLYPSLHLRYVLSAAQQLTASYSKRIQRPAAQDLNPYRVYQDPYTYREGNPFLKPQETDSFEVGWQHGRQATYYLATLFYRDAHDGVTDVVRDLGQGVLLMSKDNLGQSRSAGLELVANGRFNAALSYVVSGNVFWNEIDARDQGFAGKRSNSSLSGYAALNWQPTPRDFVQLSGFGTGKRLTPQGYHQPTGMLNLGYRHKFNDKLAAVVIVQDALKSLSDRLVVDTPALKTRRDQDLDMRALFIGLTWSFGGQTGRRSRDNGFDFQPPGVGAPT
jgi:outer membrane receptor protein involved in Fe transport